VNIDLAATLGGAAGDGDGDVVALANITVASLAADDFLFQPAGRGRDGVPHHSSSG
jgi:hypothetical protein